MAVDCLGIRNFDFYVEETGTSIWRNTTVSVFSVISRGKMSAACKCLDHDLLGLDDLHISVEVSLFVVVVVSDIFHPQKTHNWAEEVLLDSCAGEVRVPRSDHKDEYLYEVEAATVRIYGEEGRSRH